MTYDPRTDSLIFSQTSDKTVTNTTDETSMLNGGVGTQVVQANILTKGKRILVSGEGLYTVPLVTNSTMTIRVKLGGNIVATATTSSLLLGANNKAFSFNIRLVCREIGTNGVVAIGGTMNYSNSSGQKMWDDLDNAGATVPIDTTVDNMVDVTVAWNAASTTRSVTTKICTIMVV